MQRVRKRYSGVVCYLFEVSRVWNLKQLMVLYYYSLPNLAFLDQQKMVIKSKDDKPQHYPSVVCPHSNDSR